MKEKSLKLINDSIKAIRDFCSDLDIDCTEEYCPFKTKEKATKHITEILNIYGVKNNAK